MARASVRALAAVDLGLHDEVLDGHGEEAGDGGRARVRADLVAVEGAARGEGDVEAALTRTPKPQS